MIEKFLHISDASAGEKVGGGWPPFDVYGRYGRHMQEDNFEVLWGCFWDTISSHDIWKTTKETDGYTPYELDPSGQHFKDLKRFFRHMKPGSAFLDLGSGLGMACIYAVHSGASSATGIEILPERVQMAREILESPEIALGGRTTSGLYRALEWFAKKNPDKAAEYNRQLEQGIAELKAIAPKITYRQGDFLKGAVPEVSKADFIYIGASPRIFKNNYYKNSEQEEKERRLSALNRLLGEAKKGAMIVVPPGLSEMGTFVNGDGWKIVDKVTVDIGGGIFGGCRDEVSIYEASPNSPKEKYALQKKS